MKHFPLFLDLGGRRVLVVGAGEGVARKIRLLRDAGASVVVVETEHDLPQEIRALAASVRHEFRPEDVRGCALVFVCGVAGGTARSVSAAAIEAGVPVNVQDRAELSTFIMPAILDRDPITVAVSTGGASPMLARAIRDLAGAVLPRGIGRLATVLGEFRCEVADRIPSFNLRRRFWQSIGLELFDRFADGDEAALRGRMRLLLDEFPHGARGTIHIVGAGPGDPGLLTIRALRVLQIADVVLYDRLVDDRIIDRAGSRARLLYVGKSVGSGAPKQDEINRLMADLAMAGCRVVRLKSGDPFVLGRGGEEIEYLAHLGLAVEVVPGITAALGCAAYAGIPLTHRDFASSVTFISGRGAYGRDPDMDWAAVAQNRQTVVVYMGVEAAAVVASRLIENGSSPSTPVAVIEKGTRPDQRVAIGTLEGLGALIAEDEIDAPALIIIGDVVRLYRGIGTNYARRSPAALCARHPGHSDATAMASRRIPRRISASVSDA